MEQRRTRRFTLQLPLSITRSGAGRMKVYGQTRNISSSGVLFTAGEAAELGDGPIEYTITLPADGSQVVNLRCIGKVIRAERVPGGTPAYQVAATLERYEFVRRLAGQPA